MKKLILTILLSYTLGALCQDKVVVVAVGEAEQEKDMIGVVGPNLKGLNGAEKKKINELMQLWMSDFDFYRNQFQSDFSFLSKDNPKYRYIISFKLRKEVGGITYIELLLRDSQSKENTFKINREIDFKNIRTFGHKISSELYKHITGKKSIFETKIVFVSDRTSRKPKLYKELYIMDFDGKRKQRLTFRKSVVISPSISPDNSHVLFSLIEQQWKKGSQGKIQKIKNLNLYNMELRSRKMKIISDQIGINSGAVFNKTGDSIYVTLSNQKNADIYKMNLKTKSQKRITTHFSGDVDPNINADESLMTFLSGRAGRAMIYTLDPSGVEKSVKRISYVGRFNASPRFNPEGSEIVFSSWVDNRFDIYRIGRDGRNLVRLTKNFGSNEEPSYSPDGEFIVFSSQRVITKKKAVQDLYIMNREGEVIRKLTENYGKVFTPRWSN